MTGRRAPIRAVTLALLLAAAASAGACESEERDERPQDPTADFGTREGDEAPESRFVAFSVGASRIPGKLLRGASEAWELETNSEIEVLQSDDEAAIDRLCLAELPLIGTVRRVRAGERAICRANGIGLRTAKVGYHAVAVAASKALRLECLALRDLRRLWRAGSPVVTLDALRARLPRRAPVLVGAQAATSAFELFTARVTGGAGLRGDYLPVEDLAVFIERLERRERAIGFYELGGLLPLPPDGIAPVAIDSGTGCARPSRATVRSGRYRELARPVYLHLDRTAFERRQEVRSYLEGLFHSYWQHASTAGPLIPLEARPARMSARTLGVQPGPGGGEGS